MTISADGAGPTRRRVVGAGGAGLVLAGTLAACGDDDDSPVVEPDSDAGDDEEGQGGQGTGPLTVPAAEVPEGGSVYRRDGHVVLTQPRAGEFHAFDATCPHEGCAVSRSDGAELVCPCHGSRFAIETGDVVGGPAPTGLTALTVQVDGEELVIER